MGDGLASATWDSLIIASRRTDCQLPQFPEFFLLPPVLNISASCAGFLLHRSGFGVIVTGLGFLRRSFEVLNGHNVKSLPFSGCGRESRHVCLHPNLQPCFLHQWLCTGVPTLEGHRGSFLVLALQLDQ